VAITADQLEDDIRRIGADLAEAFPSSARHPLRTLDAHMTAAAHFMTDRYVGCDVRAVVSPPSR